MMSFSFTLRYEILPLVIINSTQIHCYTVHVAKLVAIVVSLEIQSAQKRRGSLVMAIIVISC